MNQTSSQNNPSRPEILSEADEDSVIRQQRRRMFPRAAFVGFCASVVAALFRAALAAADAMRNELIAWSEHFPLWGRIFSIAFSIVGAVLSVLLVQRFAPETSGSGIPHLEAVLHRLRTLNWRRVLLIKFVAGALAIGDGLALGREGPTVQMGAAGGAALSSWLKSRPKERRTLIASGAGAGLVAAFNAPLSGVIFVLEEIQRDFHPLVFGQPSLPQQLLIS
jgi:CIC family chloride channel protein